MSGADRPENTLPIVVSCPIRLQKRMRRSLVKASLSRCNKIRAEQVSRVLISLVNRQATPIVQEQKPTASALRAPETRPVPMANPEEHVPSSKCASTGTKTYVPWYCFWRRGRQS